MKKQLKRRQPDPMDVIREILQNNLKIASIQLEEDTAPLQSSLQPFSRTEKKDEGEAEWESVPIVTKKRNSWDNLSSTIFTTKPNYQTFKEAVKKIKGLDDHDKRYFHFLGKIFKDDTFTSFHETNTIREVASAFFNKLYTNSEAREIINGINRSKEYPKCLLFCIAQNTEPTPRCYVTLSGHFPHNEIIKKLNNIIDQTARSLNKEKIGYLFQFRDNRSILNINTLHAELHEYPADEMLFKQPCAEKTMTSLLAKKFFKYGYAMQVQGMLASHLEFYPPSTHSKLSFSLKSIPPCKKHCQYLTYNMLQIWTVAQLAGQTMIAYLRKKRLSEKEIRQFMERYAEKDSDFFNLINEKLNKKDPKDKITSAHLFDSPDENSCEM